MIFAVVFSSMAGYAFAKLEFPCKKLLFGLVLIQMMLPSQIFIIPQYQMLAKMGATNSIFALVFPRSGQRFRHLHFAAGVSGHAPTRSQRRRIWTAATSGRPSSRSCCR